ncbi:hypothetical protein [Chitinophaga sp. CF418]|uniref:hypothetical protein n=1 Tax=Chitinophaga sp. CF418 TaxID=1855287 RepID=UPI00091912FA|nr:hypothetical protein [Chitinophaga sp. CF418]SHN33882.1 hypothetical protein SAMN05216311_109219 [Chitinophaga sp. CF418]
MNVLIRLQFILSIVVCITCAKTYASQVTEQSAMDTSAAIAAIRTAYKNINTATVTAEVFKYESAGCAEDGQVKYFFNQKKEIVKIVESGSIGDGSWSREFYFQSGKLIFSYESQIGGPADGPETKNEYRTYIKGDQVLRFMEDKNIVPSGEKSADALKASYKLIKAYTTKKFAEALCG